MTGYVVDASVAIKWVLDEEGTTQASALLGFSLDAPELLVAECANILWKNVRRGDLTPDEAAVAARLLRCTPVRLHAMKDDAEAALQTAVTLGHPAYDCFYLNLAARLRQPLVTADLRLVRKIADDPALRAGCDVLLLSEWQAPYLDVWTP